MTLHLSPSGCDQSGDGSAARPVATLAQAIQLARHSKNVRRKILARDGIYFHTHVELTPADSGLEIAAAPGANPRFLGGAPVGNWIREGGDSPFLTAPFEAGEAHGLRTLVVNGRLAPRARFPETGAIEHASKYSVRWLSSTHGGWETQATPEELTTMQLLPGSLPESLSEHNAEVAVRHQWDLSLVGIREWNRATGQIIFSSPCGHPPGAFSAGKPEARTFVVWNTREGLTRPGQWYFDKESCRIVYWPLAGEEAESLVAYAPLYFSVLQLHGTESEPVANIRLRGLEFGLTATPLAAGGFGAGKFAGAIEGQFCPALRLENVRVRWVGGQGIRIKASDHLHLHNVSIAETGAGGIVLTGNKGTVTECEIHQVGIVTPSAIGLWLKGREWKVRNNTLHHTSYSAIAGHQITDSHFDNNRFHHVMQELADGAAIYLYAAKGCRIRGNFAHDLTGTMAHAWYLDEQSEHSVVENNLTVGVPWPIHNHMSRNCLIQKNVSFNEGDLQVSFINCEDFVVRQNLFSTTGTLIFSPSGKSIRRLHKNLLFSGAGEYHWHFHNRLATLERCEFPLPALPPNTNSLIADPRGTVEGEQVIFAPESPAALLGIPCLDARHCGVGRLKSPE